MWDTCCCGTCVGAAKPCSLNLYVVKIKKTVCVYTILRQFRIIFDAVNLNKNSQRKCKTEQSFLLSLASFVPFRCFGMFANGVQICNKTTHMRTATLHVYIHPSFEINFDIINTLFHEIRYIC